MEVKLQLWDPAGAPRIRELRPIFFRGAGAAILVFDLTRQVTMEQLDEALEITRKDVADALDGLPPIKMHCSNLAADGLHQAIEKYREKQK